MYPERLGAGVLVNAPWFFPAVSIIIIETYLIEHFSSDWVDVCRYGK
jgi:hypothetical protein